MGAWTKNKVDSSQINGGQEYTKNSNVALDQLNLITNNSFYAVDKADEALEKANSAFENNGTVISVSGSAVPALSFDSDPQTQIDNKQDIVHGIDIGYSDLYTSGTITQEQLNLLISNKNNYLIGASGIARFSNSETNNLYYVESNYVYERKITINKNTLAWSLDEFGKASLDLSNVTYPQVVADGVAKTGAGDRVVERWVSSDGNTWYEKYESGWKKCGGTVMSSGSLTETNVAFPIQFSNIFGVLINNGSDWVTNSNATPSAKITTTTNTYFSFYCVYTQSGSGGSVSSKPFCWEAKGF